MRKSRADRTGHENLKRPNNPLLLYKRVGDSDLTYFASEEGIYARVEDPRLRAWHGRYVSQPGMCWPCVRKHEATTRNCVSAMFLSAKDIENQLRVLASRHISLTFLCCDGCLEDSFTNAQCVRERHCSQTAIGQLNRWDNWARGVIQKHTRLLIITNHMSAVKTNMM